MKYLALYVLPLVVFILSGCAAARVVPYDVDRVDQEVNGNRGVVVGTVSDLPEPLERKKTRRVYDLEIELLSPREDAKIGEENTNHESRTTPRLRSGQANDGKKEVSIHGNKGYMEKKQVIESKARPAKGMLRLKSGIPGPSQTVYQNTGSKEKKYTKEKGAITVIKEEGPQKDYVVE